MGNRLWAATILVGLLAWQTAAMRADDAARLPLAGPTTTRADEVVRLPPVGPTTSSSQPVAAAGQMPAQPAEGTWREDGQHVIINLDGREIRLAKSPSAPNQSGVLNRREIAGGTVYSRLLDRGHPLVNCHVVLVPMHEAHGAYCFDPDRKPLTTTTDEDGAYRFENVAPGDYKLTWLPQGQNQWIRRIAMRPDIKVRSGETTKAKEIHVAMQTIN